MFPIGQTSIPISPPPEYKEVATPVPRNRTADERLNILPFYGKIRIDFVSLAVLLLFILVGAFLVQGDGFEAGIH